MQQRQQHEEYQYGSRIDSITIEPAFSRWRKALSSVVGADFEADRAAMGLPGDVPIVMSGHQAVVFHPGIVAKIAALMHSAKQTGAHPVWIVPDQDAVDPMRIRMPVGAGLDMTAETLQIAPSPMESVAGVSLDAIGEFDADVPEELSELVDYLYGYAGEESLAAQFGYGVVGLACGWLGVQMPTIVFASQLRKTQAFSAMVESMREDPRACVDAYNAAVAAFADGGVRRLDVDDEKLELPLWRVRPGKARERVFAHQLDEVPKDELIARGLMMTAVVRSTLCELFIHGTGGWGYDRITEHWMRAWRGVELSPMAHVTATQKLDFQVDGQRVIEPQRAKWEAHAARHNPALVGDQSTQDAKDRLLGQIKEYQDAGENPIGAYRAMHALLDEYRETNAQALKGLVDRAEEASAHRRAFELADDRTWAFVCFDADSGLRLMEGVRTQMG
ncbi:MAG: hypothetical protein JKY96_00355 [Phycisphaerales bacterium]|nr:hypothetical protein [Phycisphaerales bacterium]